jgi:hypothetical protein
MEKFMCDVIAKYYQAQKNQTVAIAQGDTTTTSSDDSVLLPVAQYSQDSSILGCDEKLRDFCGFLSQTATADTKWPADYKSQVKKRIWTEAGLGAGVSRTSVRENRDVTTLRENRDVTTLSRKLAAYRILKQLRLQECQYVALAMVARMHTVFAKYVSSKT